MSSNVFPVGGLCLRPDERYIVAGSFDSHVYTADIRLLDGGDTPARARVHAHAGHSDRVTRVSCEGDSVLSGGFDGNVRLWQF